MKNKILINADDLNEIARSQAKKVTLMNLGNFSVGDANTLVFLPDDKDYAGTLKITWLPAVEGNVKVLLKYFGHLVTKAILGPQDDFKDFVNPNSLRVFEAYVQANFLDYVKKGDIV